MNNVTIAVSDKKFKLLYGASEINAQVERMAKDIKRDMTGRKPLFICMLNGACMPRSRYLTYEVFILLSVL